MSSMSFPSYSTPAQGSASYFPAYNYSPYATPQYFSPSPPQAPQASIPESRPRMDSPEFQLVMQQKFRNERVKDERGYYEFCFDTYPLKKFSLIVGPRDTGKSTLLFYKLFRMRERIPTCAVFCSSEDGDSVVHGILPDCFVYDEINLECLGRIRERHKHIKKTLETTGQLPPGCTSDEVLLIGDDILHDVKKLHSEEFKRAILSGRHDNEGMWVLVQYAPEFPKKLRKQIDYLFLQAIDTDEEMIYIHKEFASGVIPDYNQFKELVNHYTQDYGTLVIKKKGGDRNDLSTSVFYIRALPKNQLPEFKLDAGSMFQVAEEHQKDESESGIILDYTSEDIFDYKRVCGSQAARTSTRGRGGRGGKRGRGSSHPIFKMPS
jgi:hypothetical protein